jgi:hypothetical protein
LPEQLKNRKSKAGIDAYKYCGIITLAEEPLLIQQQFRDEWECGRSEPDFLRKIDSDNIEVRGAQVDWATEMSPFSFNTM